MGEYTFRGNNLDSVSVGGMVRLSATNKEPVYGRRRDEPLKEFILEGLHKDLLECQEPLAAHFDHILTAMRMRLEDKSICYEIRPTGQDSSSS